MNKISRVFDQSFFIAFFVLGVAAGLAGAISVSVFGELGTEYPMPVYTVILRIAAMLFSVAAICAVMIYCGRFLLSGRAAALKRKGFDTAAIFLGAALILAVQLTFAFCLQMKPITDIARLDSYAVRIVNDGSFECLDSDFANHYIIRYQNNIPILLLITLMYKLSLTLTGEISQTFLLLLNSLAINSAVLMTVLMTRRLFGGRRAAVTLMICALFAPYYTYTPYFYTDSFSIPFVAGTLYAFVISVQSKTRVKKLMFMLLSGAVCLLGFEMKGSVIILVPAIMIYLPLKYGFKRALKLCAAFLLSFCLLFGSCTLALRSACPISKESSDRWQFPVWHWIMLGLNEQGAFTAADSDYSEGFTTLEERKAGELEEIGRRINAYGVVGMAGHLGYKLIWTYMDGTYYIANYLENYRHKTFLHSFILYEGEYRFAFYAYSFGFQIFLLLTVAYSAKKSRRKSLTDETTLFRIALTGMVLFFMIWETNPRYPFNFTPLLIMLSADGVCALSEKAETRLKKSKK